MIMHRNAKPWTKAETARADRMAEIIGCIYCWLDEGFRSNCDNRHHIKSGNKRMGHWYTLPVCARHHLECHDGTRGHSDQIHMWLKVQHILELPDELPRSKIVPRRNITEAEEMKL